jgi:hypothetical protein
VKLSAAQREELDATIAGSRAAIEQLDAPWHAAVAAVDPKKVDPGGPVCEALDFAASDLASNPQGWSSWSVDSPLGFNGGSTASFTGAPFPLAFLKAGEAVPAHSPGASAYLKQLDQAGGPSTLAFEDRKSRAKIADIPPIDVLVRLDEVVEPKLLEENRFVAGQLVASAWVYDHSANAVVCAGTVDVTNSTTVDPGTSNLDDDLMISLVRALPGGLRSLGD